MMAITIAGHASAKAFVYSLLDYGWSVKEFNTTEFGYQGVVKTDGGEFTVALSQSVEQAQAFCDEIWRNANEQTQQKWLKKLDVIPQPHRFWDRYLASPRQPFLGLKGPLPVHGFQVTFVARAPSEKVEKAVRETVEFLAHPRLGEVFEGELAAQRPGRFGPWAVAVAMLLSALLVLIASKPVFSFRMTVEIPNSIAAFVFGLIGAVALSRRIIPVYWFVLVRLVVDVVTINSVFEDSSLRLAGGISTTILLAAINLAILIIIPVRAKDFGFARRRELFRAIF